MDTTRQPQARIRVTPLRRLGGGTYVPRGGRPATAPADDGRCARSRGSRENQESRESRENRERPARTSGGNTAHD
ncbi:hypothetical protein [Streptomyces beigongshangae]|uniref:hypothetical protein n=1 Tax=Streptomyces beigongshangae TaxID=2841597 RepID=UPI001C845245|nr:hypothetical protein [Streptomyces sp. REN17]